MAGRRKQSEPEAEPGAPEWMVTFSDCMTLLLTFFVLMLSFSSFDKKTIANFKSIFAKRFSFEEKSKIDKDSFLPPEEIKSFDNTINKGSEKPTLTAGTENNLENESQTPNYHDRKVFLISSDKIFYGNGTVVSIGGSKILAALASFLKETPARIVISENSSDVNKDERLGMERAWSVIEFMTKKQSLDKTLFSISASGTVEEDEIEENALNKRMLEIVLLERNIYN